MANDLFTVDDLARRWQASKSLIYQASSAGRLRKIKIGNLVRFREQDVLDFEEQNAVEARQEIEI